MGYSYNMNFITTGHKFPYPYYIGVMTALKAHRGKVILWYLEEPDSDYFKLLKKQPKLIFKKTPLDRQFFQRYPVWNALDEHSKIVTMFDYLAWYTVSKNGGIIMGLDSLTLLDFQDLACGYEMVVPRDYWGVEDSYAMHGVTVRKGSKLAKQIFTDIQEVLEGHEIEGRHKVFDDQGKLVWGGMGIIPYLNNIYNNINKVKVVDPGVLCGINVGWKTEGFYVYKDKDLLNVDTRTIPLYASSSDKFRTIDESFVANTNSLYSKLVKNILTEREWNPFNLLLSSHMKYRFHIPGLVHLPVSERYMGCAYTQKIVKLCKMLLSLGHEVYVYGCEGSDVPCTEFIQTHSLNDLRDEWGEGDNRYELGYDWHNKGFKHDFNDERTQTTKKFYAECISEIRKRKNDDDFLLIMQGYYHKPIDDAVGLFLTCEPGIGYKGSYSKYKAFESAHLQSYSYGQKNPTATINGNFYDRVIPNYFDPKDFTFQEKKGDYYLYLGRLIQRKGVEIASLAVEAIGGRLVIAGQGANSWDPKKHRLVTDEFTIEGKHIDFVGYAGPEDRDKLYGGAIATFVPTLYLEPFGGTNVESQLCGTPVITTDFGVFPETVVQGVTGYRCNTLKDFVKATQDVKKLKPKRIRKHAERYLMDNVKWEFQKWFEDLYDVYESAIDPTKKGWSRL
jgi:glycosyltransferase involved in cell wall biosynthesis